MEALARRFHPTQKMAAAAYSSLFPSSRIGLRCLSSKLFVEGLPPRASDEMLRTVFGEYGPVLNVEIVTERDTGSAFVTFGHESHAEAAKSTMSNFLLDGCSLKIDMASDDRDRPFSGNAPPSSSSYVFDVASNVDGDGVIPTSVAEDSGNDSTSFFSRNAPAAVSAANKSVGAMPSDGGNNCRTSNSSAQFDTSELGETLVISGTASSPHAASVLPSDDSEDYDFRTFPDLKSSAYENYALPSAMIQRPKRLVVLKGINLDSSILQSALSMKSIPPFKGSPYNFGLKDMLGSLPPPLEAGAKPLGGFDANISFDNLKEDEEGLSAQSPQHAGIFSGTSFVRRATGFDY